MTNEDKPNCLFCLLTNCINYVYFSLTFINIWLPLTTQIIIHRLSFVRLAFQSGSTGPIIACTRNQFRKKCILMLIIVKTETTSATSHIPALNTPLLPSCIINIIQNNHHMEVFILLLLNRGIYVKIRTVGCWLVLS